MFQRSKEVKERKKQTKNPHTHNHPPSHILPSNVFFFFFWRRISDLAFHTQIPKGKISGCTGLLML